jgi:hypothetical protein
MTSALRVTAISAAMLGLVSSVEATPIEFTATLSGANEVPPVASPGTGSAIVTFDFNANTMRVQVTFSGLTSGDTASHIHCCAPPGVNAGVATTLPTFTGFPSGVTFGTYDHTFDMSQGSSYNPAFVTAHGGTATSAELALYDGMLAGDSYLNIHTTNFGGGEIRGFLVAQIPEPATLALFGFGVLGLGFTARRRALRAAFAAGAVVPL